VTLNRALRLRKSSDFQRVRQQRRSISSRLLALAWRSNDRAQVRIGFVVSKRISKRAVDRNHIKRLLSEAIKPMLANIPDGWDIVISAKYQIIDSDFHTLTHDIATLLHRARLLDPTK
jgi:ribonuclease P protein component